MFYNSSKAFISYEDYGGGAVSVSVTTPTNTAYMTFYLTTAYGKTYNSDISINYPSTYTGYYPSALPKAKAHIGELGNAIGMRGWNQLVQNGNFINTDWWCPSRVTNFSVSNNVATITTSEIYGNLSEAINLINGHKYIAKLKYKTSSSGFSFGLGKLSYFTTEGVFSALESSPISFTTAYAIGTYTENAASEVKNFIVMGGSNGISIDFTCCNAIDLTVLFGAGNEPSTVEEFKSMFPADYYPYCPNMTPILDSVNNTQLFKEVNLGTWSSLSQVDDFLSKFTHANGYRYGNTALNLGNYVTIQDGTYNSEWVIAGFDTEYNTGDTATGWGIALIPKHPITFIGMNAENTTAGGCAGSRMHTETLPAVATALQTVLGSHLISRRVILSNAVDTNATSPGYSGWNGISSGWGWYDAYCTLMSEVQVYGSTVWSGGFDVGEACEKLPIFNFIKHNYYSRSHFWLRGVASSTLFAYANGNGDADYNNASDANGVRPLIYIR